MYKIVNNGTNDWYLPINGHKVEKNEVTRVEVIENDNGDLEKVVFKDTVEKKVLSVEEEVHVPARLRGLSPEDYEVLVSNEKMDKLKKLPLFQRLNGKELTTYKVSD